MKNSRKTRKMPLKRSFNAQFPRVCMFFGTRSSHFRSILKPEVELMVLLRMRSEKKSRKTRKMPLKRLQFESTIYHGPPVYFSTRRIEILLSGQCKVCFQNQHFECQVCFETGIVIQSMCCLCNSTANFESSFM